MENLLGLFVTLFLFVGVPAVIVCALVDACREDKTLENINKADQARIDAHELAIKTRLENTVAKLEANEEVVAEELEMISEIAADNYMWAIENNMTRFAQASREILIEAAYNKIALYS